VDPSVVVVVGGVLLALLLILSLRPLPELRDAAVLVEAARGAKGGRSSDGTGGESEANQAPGEDTQDRVQDSLSFELVLALEGKTTT
jgi:hypothetical protein